ncbi:MAG: hypothetical protein PHI12_08880 [Dehalococcoidales bacterium]|nr:hypothetical protein [Dehalococcoidales bacterium]
MDKIELLDCPMKQRFLEGLPPGEYRVFIDGSGVTVQPYEANP